MDIANIDLTPAEWNLMECLWEKSPRTGKEAVDYMKDSVGWSRSTTLTMLRRMGQPGNIGNTVVFLASPAAEYITGQNLVVDGGFTEIK